MENNNKPERITTRRSRCSAGCQLLCNGPRGAARLEIYLYLRVMIGVVCRARRFRRIVSISLYN